MKILIPFAIIIALATLSSAEVHHDHSKCGHQHFKEEAIRIPVEEEPLRSKSEDGRNLATASYPNIRITTDFSNLVNGSAAFKSYIQYQLMPPVVDYFEAALRVKQPLTAALSLSKAYKTICGYNVPNQLYNGVKTDFFLIVSSSTDKANNWVASAGSCFLSQTTSRPLIARMLFNLVYTKAATGDVMEHEKNTYLTLHEMLHAFGFTSSNFPTYIDSNGNTLKNPVKTVKVDGVNKSFLDIEPLTSNLRKFYGCNTLPGALLEDDGGAGTAGSHFERRTFLYEVMTSGVITGYRISSFSFNVLEGSGWYQPDYSYAEPFYFGQGEGCNFIYSSCSATQTSFPAEFCSSSGPIRGCTANGRGGGICAVDARTDGCYYMFPSDDYDCDDKNAASNARLPKQEAYGRGAGSKCFTGTLTTQTKASQSSYCFKYTCSGSGLNTVVSVNVGSSTVVCKNEGTMSVKGFNGVINCPDPLTFCNTAGKLYCPRNCMGRGSCVNNKCVCDSGASGIDCGVVGSWGN